MSFTVLTEPAGETGTDAAINGVFSQCCGPVTAGAEPLAAHTDLILSTLIGHGESD